jgi:hypothetical protein
MRTMTPGAPPEVGSGGRRALLSIEHHDSRIYNIFSVALRSGFHIKFDHSVNSLKTDHVKHSKMLLPRKDSKYSLTRLRHL